MSDVVEAMQASDQSSGARRWILAAVVAFGVLAAVVAFWFQPQKLLIDDEVIEAAPSAPSGTAVTSRSSTDTAADATPTPTPLVLARGDFVSLDHGTRGAVQVIELSVSDRVVRVEGLETDNGPDLFVYLSASPVDGPEGSFDDDFVNLGRLKGNRGDQNYAIPVDVDVARFASIVIWCDRFDSAFGAAALRAA